MLLIRKGFPYEGDLVLCTVTKIYYNSVFVKLDEHENKSGMIHISEISPGRIRNINDYVSVGKKIVCKVLSIDKHKGHIDLSLRRVNEMQRKNKVEEIKQEQKAEKILEAAAYELKQDVKNIYPKVMEAISKKYDELHHLFQDIVIEKAKLDKFDIDPKLKPALDKLIHERIKPPIVEIKGEFLLKSYAPDGVDIVRTAIEKGLKKEKKNATMKYFGGGRYNISIKSENYKQAEKILKNITETITKHMEKAKGTIEFKKSGKSKQQQK